MGKFDGILLCSDIDGTMTMTNTSIPEENCKALKYFMDNGGKFSVATGRFPNYFEKFSDFIVPNAPTLGLNGTQIYDQQSKKLLYSCEFDGDAPGILYETLEKYKELMSGLAHCHGGFSYFIERDQENYTVRKMDMDKVKPCEIYRKKICEKAELKKIFNDENAVVYKIAVRVKDEDSDRVFSELCRNLSQYSVFRSWINGIEIQSKKADKGKGALKLKEILGNIKLLICVGDYENDVDMIKAADIGYAVGNACEALKKVADRVTVRCEDFAIAEIVKDIERML